MMEGSIDRYDALLGAKDNWEELCSRYTVDIFSSKILF